MLPFWPAQYACLATKSQHRNQNMHHLQKEKPLSEFYMKYSHPHSECRTCFNQRTKKRYRANKERAVAYKGGRCQRCGYSGSVAALDFHHLDRANKRFTIGQVKNRSFDKLRDELDKCILLCSNCHRELEFLGDEADWDFGGWRFLRASCHYAKGKQNVELIPGDNCPDENGSDS